MMSIPALRGDIRSRVTAGACSESLAQLIAHGDQLQDLPVHPAKVGFDETTGLEWIMRMTRQ